ncbi:MAG: biliverdin-producing heme oxygenase [Bacteroidales bacterium]|jgi:heme oxygenase|nr:biliverdin-producing heme oxygenase [Bacteroidales bacterium]
MLPLKEATKVKHDRAERMPFNNRMFKGQLSKAQYLLYLNQQLPIFQTIESIGLPHDSLKRSSNIQEDIDELTAEGIHADLMLKSTQAYVKYLGSLTYEQLLPHIYLNYLAIMFGGQIMKKTVPSSGRMYDFDAMQEALQSVRKVQKDAWADEVNKGFDFAIQMFAELEDECVKG